MSLEQVHTLPCPSCQHAQEVTVWSSLNVQVSPEAKEEFFNGKINVFECEQCGHSAALVTPFMYHDMELQFCVQYYPLESIGDAETLSLYHRDGSSNADLFGGILVPEEMRQKTQYMLHPHIVFNMQEALVYVLFREKLAEYHEGQSAAG